MKLIPTLFFISLFAAQVLQPYPMLDWINGVIFWALLITCLRQFHINTMKD